MAVRPISLPTTQRGPSGGWRRQPHASTSVQPETAPRNEMGQLRGLANPESEVVKLKARPAPAMDAGTLLENATGGLLVYDSQFQFAYSKQRWREAFGKAESGTARQDPMGQFSRDKRNRNRAPVPACEDFRRSMTLQSHSTAAANRFPVNCTMGSRHGFEPRLI
jgi:PAS domain-containing protein